MPLHVSHAPPSVLVAALLRATGLTFGRALYQFNYVEPSLSVLLFPDEYDLTDNLGEHQRTGNTVNVEEESQEKGEVRQDSDSRK